jgi:hypothetical protein
MLDDKSCRKISGHNATVKYPKGWCSKKFSIGNIMITTAQEATLVMNTLRRPKRLTTRGKTANWKMPSIHPYTDKHKPIDTGLKPSPPNSTDVDHINGESAIDAIWRSVSIP